MRKTLRPLPALGAGVMMAALSFAAAPTEASAASVSISCGAVGIELELCRTGAEAWASQTGNTVTIVSTPNSTTERLALYQQILAAGGSDIDVYQVDVIWPGILANHFIDLTPYMNGAEAGHFPAIVKNNTIDGDLKAMPWFTDAGVLYYRKDLLDAYDRTVPTTWTEMAETAKIIQDGERANGTDGMWGFVFQGRAYEGLTCNALEWIDSYGGGTIVDADGNITIDNAQAIAAIAEAATWIDDIAPGGVLNYAEEEARGVFQSGNAVFMRNWPYAWSLANSEDSPIKGKVGVVALPKGSDEGKSTGVLGGWQLSVSKYSQNPDVAADLVRYLTSEQEQKRRAIEGSYNPTIEALYKDPEVLEAVPFFGSLYETFANAVARPSGVTGDKYNRVSNAFWNAVHSTLSGKESAEDALASLEGQLNRVKRRGW